MHDTAAVRIKVANDAGVPPEATTRDNEAGEASGLHLVPQPREENLPPRDEPAHPVARRGASHSWLPGAWGDPF
jgi:hypothetical protein